MLLVSFPNSFVGREDRGLEDRLKAEASGVLNWSLAGLHMLRTAGGFTQPKASQTILENFERLTSPARAFIIDACDRGPTYREPTTDVYSRWCGWCQTNGHEPGADSTFGSHLAATGLGIDRKRLRRTDGTLGYFYTGLRLTGA